MMTMDTVDVPQPQARHQMDEVTLRAQEAAHLNVPRTCKWGHASFEPVKVQGETQSAEVSAIFAELEHV